MPIILLLRIILETAVSDIQTAELIEKFKKNNGLLPTCTCGGNNEIEWVQ